MFAPLSPLAGRLLLGVTLGVCFTMSACLLPQEDNLIDDLPVVRNRPPRFLEETLEPALRTSTGNQEPYCQPKVFTATVEDPDAKTVDNPDQKKDTLYGYWKVDGQQKADLRFTMRVTKDADGKATGPPRGSDTFEMSVTGSTALNAIGTHVVELVVADGTIINGTLEQRSVELPDGGAADNPYYMVSHAWVVDVTATPCPPPPP